MEIPALSLAEDLPVHPAGAGFRFPQRKLFPAFGHSAAPAGFSRGSMEETLVGEKFPNSFRLPRWEGKRPVWNSWRVGSVRWRGVSHILAPSQGPTKPLGPPGSSFCLCVSCRAGQGICDPHAPLPDSVIGSLFLGTVIGEKGETAGIATGLSWAATELRIRRLLCYAGS